MPNDLVPSPASPVAPMPVKAPMNSDMWAKPGMEDIDPAEYDEVMEELHGSKPTPAEWPVSLDDMPF